jgi:type I restriction enzyme S subunit
MSEGVTDHERVLLRDIAEPTDGAFVDGPFGSNLKSDEYVESGVRLIQLQNIGDGYWKDDNKKYITDLKFRSLARHGAMPGDIAISKMADPVARACIVPPGHEQFVVVADCIRLRVDQARFDPRYVVRAINSHGTRTEAERKSIGSTRIRINLGTLKTVGCLVPPLRQQQAIAEILDTLDTTIRQTEAIIEKLKQLKQGLLHDLLTRGIDANGELRPPQSQAPHLYKDSPLGWIPSEWALLPIASLASEVTSGARDWARFYADTGATFVRIGNLTREHVNFRLESLVFVRPPAAGDGQRTKLQAGDILISITADLGIVGVVPTTLGESYINQHIAMVRVDQERANPRFLGHFLSGHAVQRHIANLNDSGAKAGLNLPTIRGLPVAAPTQSEQRRIAERLDSLDLRVAAAKIELSKMAMLKSGLMDDLLTGRVRVTALLA